MSRVQTIIDAWEAGDTSATLGNKLGVSRNAIVGYYGRNPALRITHPLGGKRPNIKGGAKPQPDKTRSKYNLNNIQRAARIEARKAAPPQTVGHATADATRGRYTLLTLPRGCCKWPFGDDPASITYCGAPRLQTDQIYCIEHREISCT